jgi:type III secretory pathway lipoprotein EscJ
MKLEINIEQSDAMRSEIKKLIEAQVRNIAREEIAKVINEVAQRKVDDLTSRMSDTRMNNLIQAGISIYVKQEMFKLGVFSDYLAGKVQDSLIEIVSLKLDDKKFDSIVDKAAKEKVRQMIQ